MDPIAIGSLVASRYRIVERLGAGDQGTVWDVADTRHEGARYALKWSSGPEARREAETLFRLEHPALPKAIDFGTTDRGDAWLVMEHLDGRPLSAAEPDAIATAAAWVVGALAALHDAGLVHGDVKPANILARDGRAWLVDLGLSNTFASADAITAGTLRYLAPEVLAGERGPAADLFALGVSLVECVARAHPFAVDPDDRAELLAALATRRPPRDEVMRAIPAEMRGAIAWLLEHDPERRPPSARAWLRRWRRDTGATTTDTLEDDLETTHGRTALVGRERARTTALAALDDALAGRSVGVVISGPTGAGRRRLVEEIVRACRIAGAARGDVPDLCDELPSEPRRATVVLLLDADEERVARAAEAIRRLHRFDATRVPVALIASCSGAPEASDLVSVPLHPLERAEVRELLTALHGAPVPAACVDAWIDATAALPGRIVSVAHDLGPSRIANATRDTLYTRAATLHRARLPEGLDAHARRAATALCLAGGILSRATLSAALGDNAGTSIAGLLARGVVRARLGALSLSTPVDPETLAPDELRDAARALDDALARTAPNDHGARARVAMALGDHTAAWHHAERAAADATVSRAEAVRILERCADAAPDRAVYALRLARTLLLAGEAPRALEALADAPRSPEGRIVELDALRRAGSWDAARALAKELSADPSPSARAVGGLALARDLLDQGDPSSAEHTLDALDHEALPALLRPRALEIGALVALSLGDLDRARERLDRADDLALSAGDGAQRARVRSLLGMLAQRSGDHDAARRCYRDAWSLACASGDAHAAATYMANLGGAELECGALGEALRGLTRATRSLASLGRMPDLARGLANLASLLAWIGDRGAARDVARRAEEAAATVGDVVAQAFARTIAADALDDGRAAGEGLLAAAAALRDAGDDTRASEARARAVRHLVHANALDAATRASESLSRDGAMAALARLELSLAARSPAAGLDALLAAARDAVRDDPAAEHELWLLSLDAQSARLRGDRTSSQRASASLRARVDALAATLPAERAAAFAELHGPREEPLSETSAARDATRWRRLMAITQRLNDEPRLRALLELVMDAIVELTGASRGFLLLKGDDGELRIRTARNIGERDLDGDDMAFSRSVAETVARSGNALVTVDASADGRFDTSASVAAMQLRSILAVPLRLHGEVVGTVYVDDRFRAGAFDDDAVEVARAFADTAAVAIHNARVRADLQRALRRAERLSEELERRVDAQRVELEAVRQTLASDATRGRYDGLIGRGAAMTRLLGLVDRVSPTAMPVLLQGESGTGKELVARAIHANSARASRAFIAENCGAIPETLLESVLFGHVRGAFTGADRNRAGLFEVADGGTLFLDEVGEMSPAMQAKLLRVLQEGEVRPVGGERARKVDVRVIAATHRDLSDMVKKGTFREDLYYRLAVMVLPIPALRERREDIPALVAHMLQRHGKADLQIDRKAMARLVGAPWPGNVRQLENELQRAAVLADGIIREEDLNATLPTPNANAASGRAEGVTDGLDLRHAVADVEREMVERALKEHGWNQSRAAKALGLSRFGLQKKLKRLGIPSRDPQQSRLRLVK